MREDVSTNSERCIVKNSSTMTEISAIKSKADVDMAHQLSQVRTYTLFESTLPIHIREYDSTRDGTEKNGCPYISIASDELKSLVIYTTRF